MGIRKIYDAAVKTRTYQDQRTGEQRAVWKDDAKDSVWLTLPALKTLAQGWAERAPADSRPIPTPTAPVPPPRPVPPVAPVERQRPPPAPPAAPRKSCAWELLRTLSEMEKENPSEDGLIPPHDADRESA